MNDNLYCYLLLLFAKNLNLNLELSIVLSDMTIKPQAFQKLKHHFIHVSINNLLPKMKALWSVASSEINIQNYKLIHFDINIGLFFRK